MAKPSLVMKTVQKKQMLTVRTMFAVLSNQLRGTGLLAERIMLFTFSTDSQYRNPVGIRATTTDTQSKKRR